MGSSTFSGPLRVGAAGQSACVPAYFIAKFPFAQIVTTPGTTIVVGKLPPGAKLLSAAIEVSAALVTTTQATVSLGKGGGTGVEFVAATNTGAVVARTVAVLAGGADAGASGCDLTATIIATTGGNATAGEVTVMVGYIVP